MTCFRIVHVTWTPRVNRLLIWCMKCNATVQHMANVIWFKCHGCRLKQSLFRIREASRLDGPSWHPGAWRRLVAERYPKQLKLAMDLDHEATVS